MKKDIITKSRNYHFLSLGLALLLCSFFPGVSGSAFGYDPKSYTWPSDPNMRVASISFPSGSTWRSDLENGMGRWNGMWGMWLEFDYSFVGDVTYSNGDGNNSVGFVSDEDIDGYWGLTWTDSDGDEIVETDITFNVDISWNTGAQDERTRDETQPSFRKVVVHEFGHSLGLKHYCAELAQMAQGYAGHVWYGGNSTYRHHPSPDDCQGARFQYPYPSNSEEDATLMNFEMDGACDSETWRNNSVITTVSAGGEVDVEYTVCNVGNVGINFSLGVYLSSNDYISTSDTYIGGFSYYLPAHYAWERDKTFSIPSSVSPGTYYIGAVVDIGSILSEVRESNNRLVFPGQWIIE